MALLSGEVGGVASASRSYRDGPWRREEAFADPGKLTLLAQRPLGSLWTGLRLGRAHSPRLLVSSRAALVERLLFITCRAIAGPMRRFDTARVPRWLRTQK